VRPLKRTILTWAGVYPATSVAPGMGDARDSPGRHGPGSSGAFHHHGPVTATGPPSRGGGGFGRASGWGGPELGSHPKKEKDGGHDTRTSPAFKRGTMSGTFVHSRVEGERIHPRLEAGTRAWVNRLVAGGGAVVVFFGHQEPRLSRPPSSPVSNGTVFFFFAGGPGTRLIGERPQLPTVASGVRRFPAGSIRTDPENGTDPGRGPPTLEFRRGVPDGRKGAEA